MIIAARQSMMTGKKITPVEVGYITSNGNVAIPLDWVFTEDMLTAKHTFIGSVSGAWSSGNQYKGYLFSSQMFNASSDMTDADKGGFRFYCSNSDRRHTLCFGYQGWWNYANGDNYTYNQFHTFSFQHSSTLRQFGTYTRDGIAVTMVADSIYGNVTTSNRDPTYNNRPIVLFGRYDYLTGGLGYFDVNPWKFGGWKIELNNQVIHDYVPAMKGQILGVWDKVTGNFFNPVGTGQLSYGSR